MRRRSGLGKFFEGLNQKSALTKFERVHRSVPGQEGLPGNLMVEAKSKIFDVIAVFRRSKTLPLGFPCKSCRNGPKVIDFAFDALEKWVGEFF